ncbi:LuxR C-terminal-related transcriptional regulator [Roseateles sp. So40a]|uniref:LuxR C-terminal-related transcriptional regulator n=1 Tax=Roseateles sp. So40a TaxID=3400226 RepID=UPI003A8514EF
MSKLAASSVRVFIDYPTHPVIALGLKAALDRVFDFDVQSRTDDALRWAGEFADVVVTGYSEELRPSKRLRADGGPPSRILVVATDEKEREIRGALQRGVTGYVLLGSELNELSDAIRAVNRGQSYLSATVARRIAESFTRESLTPRESEVLQLLSDGACNKHIAQQLDIAIGTVKAHVKSVMEKLSANSRTQAARIAANRGLVVDRMPILNVPRAADVGRQKALM